MSQSRMEAESSKQTSKAVSYRNASDISSLVSKVDSVTNKVTITYGANTQCFDNLAGKTVGQIKKSLRDIFNIPGDADAIVDNKVVNDDFILENLMSLEFSKTSGIKGLL